jgi:hypothetical protein
MVTATVTVARIRTYRLRRHAARSAHEVDAELLAALSPSAREALRSTLTQVGAAHGLDY